jgi:8-oxo-dGTP diphosphatase
LSGIEASAGPVFGEKTPGVSYRPRPASYGILPGDEGRVAVIETKKGLFLPGGGREGDETPEACLHREILEELGLRVEIVQSLGEATQFFHAVAEATHYVSPGRFFLCRRLGTAKIPGEEDHRLHWVSPEEAGPRFIHDTHGWAVGRFLSQRKERRKP